MIKNVLTHIGGVELYGIVSISLFFAFFIGMLIWAFRQSRSQLDDLGRIPLEEAPIHPKRSHSASPSAHE